MQPPSAILHSSSKKFLYFLIFQKVELSRSNIKNFLIFQQTSYISGSNFPSFKNEKTLSEKVSHISGNRTFYPQAQKPSYILGGTSKAPKTEMFYISQKKLLIIFFKKTLA